MASVSQQLGGWGVWAEGILLINQNSGVGVCTD